MTSIAAIQAETLNVLSGLVHCGEHLALVDFPLHQNSGDSLIYLGQLEYLRKIGAEVRYVADQTRYSPSQLRRAVPTGPILIQGGGNFGDRWLEFQEMRERVIRDFPDRRIIQLPQSLDFSDGPRLRQAQAVLGAHPALVLLFRDRQSLRRAKEWFPAASVLHCPDMAFGFMPETRESSPDFEIVLIRRRDTESTPAGNSLSLDRLGLSVEFDWGLVGRERFAHFFLKLPGALQKRIPFVGHVSQKLMQWCYVLQARLNVQSAIKKLNHGEIVLTNRLHAVILAVLLGKEVVAIDNANGKISAIMDDYLQAFEGVQLAENAASATEAVKNLVKAKI
ncbi:polysaccharide pyruvyl transferase family protein [Arthrobacter sp. AOP36-A1-22]|uniref:polysaccharide pyruvyl transferase family protein n=1 Tax=Arthrobacter sp. AOP36-A1-22 TaxID=3457684 RepID=UPI004033A394